MNTSKTGLGWATRMRFAPGRLQRRKRCSGFPKNGMSSPWGLGKESGGKGAGETSRPQNRDQNTQIPFGQQRAWGGIFLLLFHIIFSKQNATRRIHRNQARRSTALNGVSTPLPSRCISGHRRGHEQGLFWAGISYTQSDTTTDFAPAPTPSQSKILARS